jgi:hypothetical protein
MTLIRFQLQNIVRKIYIRKMSTILRDPAQSLTSDVHIVAPAWLKANLASVSVLDVTWYMPPRQALPDYLAVHINGARFLDIEAVS